MQIPRGMRAIARLGGASIIILLNDVPAKINDRLRTILNGSLKYARAGWRAGAGGGGREGEEGEGGYSRGFIM